MRVFLGIVGLAALAACSPPVPDSAEGVGFDNYDTYLAERQARERALMESRQNVRPPTAETQAKAAASAPAAQPQAPVVQQQQPQAQPKPKPATAPQPQNASQPTVSGADNPGISDEQDFSAVSSRETIESDRERLKRNREQYKQFEPTEVPKRAADGRPNIVEFALQTNNAPGQAIYRRSGFRSASSNERHCAKYGSADIAQEAFLANGGPTRDRENLDPDGDGFACGWDPRPFRNAVRR